MAELTVQEILEQKEAGLDLELLAGSGGLCHVIRVPKIQKPGLALAGYLENLHTDRIQVLGETELSYLNKLPPDRAALQAERLCSLDLSCLIITKGQVAPSYLCAICDQRQIPLLRTRSKSAIIISLITKFLEERLLPTTVVHGVLVDVLGIGVLLAGNSGVGKSECALDLILRGARLVADDAVKIRLKLPSVLFGEGMELSHFHMEVRGLGILNIKHLFGVAAVRERKKIDLVVRLIEPDASQPEDRLGLTEKSFELLGVSLPLVEIPLYPGRNLATMVEVAARNFVLKDMGYHSAREFERMLERRLAEAARSHAQSIIGDNLE